MIIKISTGKSFMEVWKFIVFFGSHHTFTFCPLFFQNIILEILRRKVCLFYYTTFILVTYEQRFCIINGTWEKNNATFFWTSILVVVCFFINMIMSNVRNINRNYTSKLGTLIIGKKDMKFIHNKAFSPYLLVIAFMTMSIP